MRSICVVGHSHMVAPQKHCSTNGATQNEYRFIQLHDANFSPAVSNGSINARLLETLNEEPFDALVSMAAGNDHSIFGMLNHPVKFDFVLPERPDLPLQSGADIVPYKSVSMQLESRVAPWGAFLASLRAATQCPIFHVESPPPVPSEEHIRKHPGVFAEKIDELGVAPAAFRYKLWRLHSALFRKMCEDNGVGFIPAPAAMRDENDMMVRDAWNPDPTHGNAIYGLHVCRSIDEALEKRAI